MANSDIGNPDSVRILNFIKEGEDKTAFDDYKKATIILGNTGSGKTTFTKFISGNNENLYSQEVSENSGEYLIIDEENKISVNSTIISKTTFPELMIDEKTKNVYIDNPGFNDSRNEAYDIAASYFIKKVLQNIRNVKLVLVISYPSLRKGVLRNDFTQLLQHFTKMLKNLDKYETGIALIATKVDNSYIKRGGQLSLVSDNKILENIAEFLKEVRDNFKNMLEKGSKDISNVRHEEEMKFYENSITLLDTILKKENGTYTRLGIFRRPDMAGKLSEIPLVQENKKNLKSMLQHNLQYVKLDKTDVGYTISEKSKNVIHDLVNELNKEVKSYISAIGTNLIEFYKSKERSLYTSDMFSVLEILNKGLTTLSELKTVDYSIDGEQLIKDLSKKLKTANYIVPEIFLRKIFKLGNLLKFLENVSSKKFDSETWKWADELNGAYSYVENSILWYDLLERIYPRFGEYKLQTKFENQFIPDFEKVFHAEDETMLLENVTGFMNFIEQFNDNPDWLKSTNFPQMKKIRVDKIKLRYLDAIIESTLKQSVDQICSKNNFTVVGEFIRLSQIINHSCYPGSSLVQIFAKNTIFLDTDMVGEKDVAILAQRWHVIGDRLINLDGAKGDNHYFSKAQSGSEPGSAGHDGLPGLPGRSAGNFFGIGEILENIERLTITGVGGDGSNGQDGGNGQKGRQGTSYYLSENSWPYVYCGGEKRCEFEVEYYKDSLFHLNVKSYITYKFYGTEGSKGGDAGKGGTGGLAGKAGIIKFFTLSENYTSPKIVTKDGKMGTPGRSGFCGYGGDNGNDRSYQVRFGTWSAERLNENYIKQKIGTGPSGEVSQLLNDSGLKEPDQKIIQYSPSHLISDYRNHLLNNLNNSVKQRSTRAFYFHLLNENNFNAINDDETLISEFLEMEKNYNRFQPNVNIFLYDALLERLVDSAKNSDKISPIKSLYSAIRCKQIRLESAPQYHLIGLFSNTNLFSRFEETEIDIFYDKMVAQKLKEIELFLFFDLAISVDNLSSFQDANLSRSLNSSEFSDEQMINILSSWKVCNEFAKTEKLLRIIADLVKLEFETTASTNIKDVVFKENDFNTIFLRLRNANVESDLFNKQRELEFINVITKKRDNVALMMVKERRLLDSENLYFEQNPLLLRDAERRLERVKYGSIDEKISALAYALKIHENVHAFVKRNFKNSDLLDAMNIIDLNLKLIELDVELFERLKTSNIHQLAKVVDILRNRKEFIISDDRIENTVKILEQLVHSISTDYSQETVTFDIIKDPNVLNNLLEGLKTMIHNLDSNSEIYDDLLQIIQNIDSISNALIRILDTLPSYKDRKMLNAYARYIELQPTISNNLKLSVKNDIAFFEYERLLHAFQKYVFPYEEIKFASGDLPDTPSYTNDLSDLRVSLSSNVNYLKKKIITLESSTDDRVLEGNFSAETANGAFFTWKNVSHKKTLSRLLRGEKVALIATIRENSKLDMIKFSTIRPRFIITGNHNEQKSQFEEVLKNFHMIMEHSGGSYFSFCRRVYVFEGDSSVYFYNFNVTDDATAFVNDFVNDDPSTWPIQDDNWDSENGDEVEYDHEQTDNIRQSQQTSTEYNYEQKENIRQSQQTSTEYNYEQTENIRQSQQTSTEYNYEQKENIRQSQQTSTKYNYEQTENIRQSQQTSTKYNYEQTENIRQSQQTSTKYNYEQKENIRQSQQTSIKTPIESVIVDQSRYVHSPYTMWHFQLQPSNGNSTMLELLDKFREFEFDLQLEGHARYISTTDENVCLQFEKSDHSSSHIVEISEKKIASSSN